MGPPTDESKPAVQIDTAANFSASHDTDFSLFWATDDDLFFWAGTSSSAADLFRYTFSSGALAQITASGGTSVPYGGAPTMQPNGGWFSPNGKYFYFLASGTTAGGTQIAIRAIDLAAATVKDITSNLLVISSSANIETAATGSQVFFYAETGSSNGNDDNLYVFDQDAATAPTKLTSFGATNLIYDIMPNADGSLVAFPAGPASPATDLYVVQVQGTPVVRRLTSGAGTVSEMKWFTPDNRHVVYGAGSSPTAMQLYTRPGGGGAAVTFEPSAAYQHLMMVY